MATMEDLKLALKETLFKRGVLGDIKAKIRSEIFAALDDQEVSRPRLNDENLLINELIREYLQHNNYHHSLSVFLAESGQPAQPVMERVHMARELKVSEDAKSRSVPLLYGLVRGLRPNYPEPVKPEPSMPRRGDLFTNEPEPFEFTKL
jgi:lisH domain-containing protein FOPNL